MTYSRHAFDVSAPKTAPFATADVPSNTIARATRSTIIIFASMHVIGTQRYSDNTTEVTRSGGVRQREKVLDRPFIDISEPICAETPFRICTILFNSESPQADTCGQEIDFMIASPCARIGRSTALSRRMNSEESRHDLVDSANTAPDENSNAQGTNDLGEPLDDVLVNEARAGDVCAFGELIKRHRGACMKRAMFMLRNRSDAEDEVQNAFWKAFQRLDQFRREGSFSAWLNRIVENQCLMRIREDQNARFVYLDKSTESNVRLELVSQKADPEDALGLDEVLVLLRREISRMPPLLRNVMLLRDLDQLPMPDVANRLGLSVPAAKSRLMRARTELRSRVTKHCGRKGAGTLMQVARHEQSAYTRAH